MCRSFHDLFDDLRLGPGALPGLRPEISLKINGLLVGTPDTRAESMLCEGIGSAGRWDGLGEPLIFRARRGGKSYNQRRHYGERNHLGDLASAIGVRSEESAIVAKLKAGSEAAYAWLIGEFQQPVYGLVYRIVNDPADAADTTQDVFLKVFRGMKHFHGESSLKTWIYRIALHEAANRRRWWFRHRRRRLRSNRTPRRTACRTMRSRSR